MYARTPSESHWLPPMTMYPWCQPTLLYLVSEENGSVATQDGGYNYLQHFDTLHMHIDTKVWQCR